MELSDWNAMIAALPGAHVLQTKEWAAIKEPLGWNALPQVWRDDSGQVKAAAMVLQRTISFKGIFPHWRVLYIPRGPLLDWEDEHWRPRVLNDLQALAKSQRAIFIKIDPDLIAGLGIPGDQNACEEPVGKSAVADLKKRGWLFSDDQIQFRNTVCIDLSQSEESWLARMKQKARYNLRLAQKKGVKVRPATADELHLLYRMYAETSVRDGFVIRPEEYYQSIWRRFIGQNMAEPLIAEVDGEPVGGLIWFCFAGKAWYLYGMSREIHRDKMPNYLLQWEAMKRAKSAGCLRYDLWGAPDNFNDQDPLWGVYRFKEGLGGQVVRLIGAWDYPSQPILYRLYTRILPPLLDVMRRRGKAQTRQEITL
jgi:peptidoglycan pentaglycine glycine transferase (the first glycine)